MASLEFSGGGSEVARVFSARGGWAVFALLSILMLTL